MRPSPSRLQNSQTGGFALRDRLNGHRDIGLFLPMKFRHSRVIHAIKMVARQDQHIFRARRLDLEQLLADRVRGALIPGGALRRLFSRPDLHPAGVEHIEIIDFGNVTVERNGIELRQDRHAVNPRIDAIANGNVNETIFPRDRHGRLRAHLGQRMQTRPASASHNDTQDIVHRWHSSSFAVIARSVCHAESTDSQ